MRPGLCTDFAKNKISEEDNLALVEAFSAEEVKRAIDACNSSKSPGPNGFNFGFFKRFWGMLKDDIMRLLEEFHQHGRLVSGLNTSFMVLIPKKVEAEDLQDYMPISLIEGVYKMISKILANRLSKVLEPIILENQSAFVGGRQLIDSVVTLNEIIEEMKAKKKKAMLYKIDFAKAYDSVEWGYLREIMERFNFNSRWIQWVMECVTSAHASVLVNGSPSGNFKMERGLRQGDPLSPFLFLLAAEEISLMMNMAVESELFKPVEVGRDKIQILHLQFADDTLFVRDANEGNILFLKRFLTILELALGLRINRNKCNIYGINLEENWVEQ